MFQWEEKYSVGIQSIDNQHKEIFKHLNNLLEAMKQGKAENVTFQIIIDLEKYAVVHFQKEEFFFHRFSFSGSAEHILEHQLFIQKITTLKTDLKSGKTALSFELLNFLKEWIDHHILVADKAYSECFRQNGLK
jgi:hemerythrin-like metal-binding protein